MLKRSLSGTCDLSVLKAILTQEEDKLPEELEANLFDDDASISSSIRQCGFEDAAPKSPENLEPEQNEENDEDIIESEQKEGSKEETKNDKESKEDEVCLTLSLVPVDDGSNDVTVCEKPDSNSGCLHKEAEDDVETSVATETTTTNAIPEATVQNQKKPVAKKKKKKMLSNTEKRPKTSGGEGKGVGRKHKLRRASGGPTGEKHSDNRESSFPIGRPVQPGGGWNLSTSYRSHRQMRQQQQQEPAQHRSAPPPPPPEDSEQRLARKYTELETLMSVDFLSQTAEICQQSVREARQLLHNSLAASRLVAGNLEPSVHRSRKHSGDPSSEHMDQDRHSPEMSHNLTDEVDRREPSSSLQEGAREPRRYGAPAQPSVPSIVQSADPHHTTTELHDQLQHQQQKRTALRSHTKGTPNSNSAPAPAAAIFRIPHPIHAKEGETFPSPRPHFQTTSGEAGSSKQHQQPAYDTTKLHGYGVNAGGASRSENVAASRDMRRSDNHLRDSNNPFIHRWLRRKNRIFRQERRSKKEEERLENEIDEELERIKQHRLQIASQSYKIWYNEKTKHLRQKQVTSEKAAGPGGCDLANEHDDISSSSSSDDDDDGRGVMGHRPAYLRHHVGNYVYKRTPSPRTKPAVPSMRTGPATRKKIRVTAHQMSLAPSDPERLRPAYDDWLRQKRHELAKQRRQREEADRAANWVDPDLRSVLPEMARRRMQDQRNRMKRVDSGRPVTAMSSLHPAGAAAAAASSDGEDSEAGSEGNENLPNTTTTSNGNNRVLSERTGAVQKGGQGGSTTSTALLSRAKSARPRLHRTNNPATPSSPLSESTGNSMSRRVDAITPVHANPFSPCAAMGLGLLTLDITDPPPSEGPRGALREINTKTPPSRRAEEEEEKKDDEDEDIEEEIDESCELYRDENEDGDVAAAEVPRLDLGGVEHEPDPEEEAVAEGRSMPVEAT